MGNVASSGFLWHFVDYGNGMVCTVRFDRLVAPLQIRPSHGYRGVA
jgi:hypothetical protein